jgi:putative ABC transport system permease protein
MGDLLQDIRYSIRVLVAKPGFTLVAVLTIALGIGANTAIFSVINSVLLQPLPFDEPDRLTLMWTTTEEDANAAVSWMDFVDWREQAEGYEGVAVFRRENHILTGIGVAERLLGAKVSAGFFDILGLSVQLGRSFTPDEDEDGSGKVVVISHGTWQTRFGGIPDVIGRSIGLNGEPMTVIGVLPVGFQFPADLGDTEIWTTMAGDPFKTERGTRSLRAVGRLKADVSIEQAQAEMDEIAGRLEEVYEGNVGRGIHVVGLHDQLVGESRPALLILFAAVSAVLLIACANLASLLLARGTDRQREFSVRAALGAGRWRIARQLLTESTSIGLMGGGLALLFALWGLDGLQAMIPEELVAVGSIELDRTVLAFAFILSIATGLVFGLLPALAAANPDLIQGLKEGIRGTDGRSRTRLRSALVIAEVGMASVLLVGAGLLLRSFWVLTSVDPGFDPRNAMTFQMSMPFALDTINDERAAFYDDVLLRITEISGVESASAITMLPMEGGEIGAGLEVVGRDVAESDRPTIRYNSVTPGYFRSMRIPMLQGRDFEPAQD